MNTERMKKEIKKTYGEIENGKNEVDN